MYELPSVWDFFCNILLLELSSIVIGYWVQMVWREEKKKVEG